MTQTPKAALAPLLVQGGECANARSGPVGPPPIMLAGLEVMGLVWLWLRV